MSSRKVYSAPTFQAIEDEKFELRIEREIKKIKPVAEVTVEGMTEVAKGQVVDWHPSRHFFEIKWEKRSEAFAKKIASQSELRAFFKVKLFSTQLIFKTIAVRQFKEELYHFRIPQQLYQQQLRGALRVPIIAKNAVLVTPHGDYEILDLSTSGARLNIKRINPKVRLGSNLLPCELKLGRKKTGGENFGVKITSENDTSLGCRFAGLDNADKVTIKQFLVEALRIYYKEEL